MKLMTCLQQNDDVIANVVDIGDKFNMDLGEDYCVFESYSQELTKELLEFTAGKMSKWQ